ncbi:MAG: hypothetical protein L3J29_13320 [Cyclobacteriaceae bacterium]|nr:hypothetical protein [Cyclobacteriaceae bacterium]
MGTYEKKKIDNDFKKFTSLNFEKPAKCKSIGQLQYYVQELTRKIKELKGRFNYVPEKAFHLLTEYNNMVNNLIFKNYQEVYSY